MQLRRALFITFFSSNAANVVQFAVTVILSRLLSPAEVGIYSITAVFVAITIVFRDFGVSTYLQREKELTPDKIKSALGLLIFTSWSLSGFLYTSSNYVADYYEQPGIGRALRVLCISFLIVPFASFVSSLLARELQAGKTAIATGFGTLAYAVTCITMAYFGFSYMSLAWANVANLLITLLVYSQFLPSNISFRPSFKGWSAPAKYGGGAVLGSLVDRLNYSIPDLAIGKMRGTMDVGLYSRANGLVGLFQQVIGPMVNYSALPYIASRYHAKQPIGPLLSKSISYLTGLAWPAYIFIAIYADEVISLLYGSKWLASSPIVVLICIQAAARTGFGFVQPALMAIGKPYLSALATGINALFRLGFIFTIQQPNLYRISLAICLADTITLFAPAILMHRYLNFDFTSIYRAHIKSFYVSTVILITLLTLHAITPFDTIGAYKLIIAVLVIIISLPFFIFAFKHPLYDEFPYFKKEIISQSKKFLKN